MIDFMLTALTYVAIQSVLSLGLNLQWGLTGLLNLAYILFMATGAYFSAVVVSDPASPPGTEYILGLREPFLAGVVAGVLAATVLAVVVGAVALRNLRADYFAIVTLVIAEGTQQIAGQFRGLFNGSAGLVAIPQPLETVFQGRDYAVFFLLLCIGCVMVCFVVAEWLRKSPFGRALRALREDEEAASAFGRNPYTLKLRAFVIGASMAGLGGSLLGAYVTAFAPAGWGVAETLLVLVCSSSEALATALVRC
ncbi:MAG: branched-chain amino acid ABC transporter permease [Pseudonocardiales bacterium]|nr:MAG: branched-chain amino acid ABC transporter permease [Pseudonocardiales bacterium]